MTAVFLPDPIAAPMANGSAGPIAAEVESGRCRVEGGRLRLTPDGLLFADGVAAEFLAGRRAGDH